MLFCKIISNYEKSIRISFVLNPLRLKLDDQKLENTVNKPMLQIYHTRQQLQYINHMTFNQFVKIIKGVLTGFLSTGDILLSDLKHYFSSMYSKWTKRRKHHPFNLCFQDLEKKKIK